MNVGGLTWEQAADALGCTTAAMAQWKTGKTGLAPKTLYRLEQLEEKLGIKAQAPMVRDDDSARFAAKDPNVELREDLRELKKDLAAMDLRVEKILKRIGGK